MNFTEMSHIKVAEALGGRKLRFAVDATLGRGRDALFAMSLLGGGGELFGFDVQARAIEESRRLFESKGLAVSTEDFPVAGARAKFFRASHADMETLLPERARGKIGAAQRGVSHPQGKGRRDERAPAYGQVFARAGRCGRAA